jgi:hypothetical protein
MYVLASQRPGEYTVHMQLHVYVNFNTELESFELVYVIGTFCSFKIQHLFPAVISVIYRQTHSLTQSYTRTLTHTHSHTQACTHTSQNYSLKYLCCCSVANLNILFLFSVLKQILLVSILFYSFKMQCFCCYFFDVWTDTQNYSRTQSDTVHILSHMCTHTSHACS